MEPFPFLIWGSLALFLSSWVRSRGWKLALGGIGIVGVGAAFLSLARTNDEIVYSSGWGRAGLIVLSVGSLLTLTGAVDVVLSPRRDRKAAQSWEAFLIHLELEAMFGETLLWKIDKHVSERASGMARFVEEMKAKQLSGPAVDEAIEEFLAAQSKDVFDEVHAWGRKVGKRINDRLGSGERLAYESDRGLPSVTPPGSDRPDPLYTYAHNRVVRLESLLQRVGSSDAPPTRTN